VEFEKSFMQIAGTITGQSRVPSSGPWPYLRVIRRSSSILNVEQTSFEKPHVSRFELVDGADQLHVAFGLAFPAFG